MLLLELGADPDALDGIGRRPWQVAETAFGGLTAPKNAQGAAHTIQLWRVHPAPWSAVAKLPRFN
jgi:hypothetical protein